MPRDLRIKRLGARSASVFSLIEVCRPIGTRYHHTLKLKWPID
jgi:hypothetical protein